MSATMQSREAVIEAKRGPCRVCTLVDSNGYDFGVIELRQVVRLEDGGCFVADNTVPLHTHCRSLVDRRDPLACLMLIRSLDTAEYAYMLTHGGPDYPMHTYGVRA